PPQPVRAEPVEAPLFLSERRWRKKNGPSTSSGRTEEARRSWLHRLQRTVIVALLRTRELLSVRIDLAAFIAGNGIEELADRRLELRDLERLAAGLGQAFRIDQQLVAQHGLELAGVHFRHQHMLEAAQQ